MARQFSKFSHFRSVQPYMGPLKACIMDWSGTTIDKYVLAPVVVFVEIFKKYKVPISMEEARAPMGLRKDMHIKAITEMPDVQKRWYDVYGRNPNQGDVDSIFKDAVPIQLEVLPKYCTLLPGALSAIDKLRSDFDLKIGCTTGFTRSMVDIVLEEVNKQGYFPDANVAGDDVINGSRPKPHMLYRNLDLLDIHPIQSVVKVDDTVSGIIEAQNAGCWSVGVARYSNYMNIDSIEQESELNETEISFRLDTCRDILSKSGAHYIIDSIADLPETIEKINQRLLKGERPY